MRPGKLWAIVLKTESSCSIEGVYSNSQATSIGGPKVNSLPNAIDSLPTRLPWRYEVLIKTYNKVQKESIGKY